MNNVISFNREVVKEDRPEDLFTFSQLKPYGYKYGYLYKWSVLAKKSGLKSIPLYFENGSWKLSLKEVKEFEKKRGEEKYGRN